MFEKKLKSIIVFSALCIIGEIGTPYHANSPNFATSIINKFSLSNACFSQDKFAPMDAMDFEADSQNEPKPAIIDLNQVIDEKPLTENESFYHLVNATDKFVQCNIRASWEDFKNLMSRSQENDFFYISFADKMSDLGLFDLANLATSKIKDKDITGLSIDAMQRYYYPRRKLRLEDELFLAEIYSNIIYNNQSNEATNELLKNDSLLSDSDYANYLVALGSYKSGILPQAKKYINLAILQNPSNLNYQALKAQILAQDNDPTDALKTVDNLKKQNLYSYEYEKKIKSLEQFVLYKIQKPQWEKDYHLGYYYYYENDNVKAIRTLESALSTKKRANKGVVLALMSKIYLEMNEFEKAADSAKKAYAIDNDNVISIMTLGDLSFKNKNYKQALNYYKKASSNDKKSYTALVKEAQTYQLMSNVKKASEIYAKVLKSSSDNWEAYYNVAMLDKNKRAIYLKKALAVNPLYENGWIELAKTEIDNGSYEIAQKYLNNAFYIDEKDFRYYYYQGLVDSNLRNFPQAELNFKKCLKLNANYKDAQDALNSVQYSRNGVGQDSI